MRRGFWAAAVLWVGLVVVMVGQSVSPVSLSSTDLVVRIDERGQVASLRQPSTGRELLATGQPAPLLQIRIGDRIEGPTALTFDARAGILTLSYATSGVTLRVRATPKPTHIVFSIVDVAPAGKVDAVTWGPYPTTIGETVGEIIGVVRDASYAFGLQVLNIKTLGGLPSHDDGSDTSRSRVAQSAPFGSVLQAYALDRSRPRKVQGWAGQYPNMPVAPIDGETVVGSSIALFGAPVNTTLDRIGAIEVAEGLPHPTVDGVWVKQWKDLGRSYLIAAFNESTVDELLAFTQRAGLMTLYHPEPFASWGHYTLDPKSFPSGDEGMRAAVAKGNALGIRIGAHTLTNFINTTDAYVTPVPDSRLSQTGASTLTSALDAAATTIPVAAPEFFTNEKFNWLHTVVIDQELIRYRAVSTAAPWTLLDVERGAFGTTAAPHRAGAVVGKLVDHPYKTFYPTLDLQDEIARHLAAWFNETGVSQMDFDGHEGALGTGQGDYAIERFAKVFYDALDHPVLNGTSNSEPFYWHINTYCNWGEPWYGGFRESMQEYRLKNQALFERNFIPHMLGWYRLTATTSVSEMEWMLARAAGHDAGFAMSTTLRELRANGETGALLDAIREWEEARRTHAFSAAQREQLKDPAREFHLEARSQGVWDLYPFHLSPQFTHAHELRQPGEPASSTWTLTQTDEAQPLQFRLQVLGENSGVERLRLDVDGAATVEIPVALKSGESLVCDGTAIVRVYDDKGRQTRTVMLPRVPPTVAPGRHTVAFDAAFTGEGGRMEATFKTRGAAERVRSSSGAAR